MLNISRISEARICFLDIETARMKIEGYTYSLKQYSDRLDSDWVKRGIWMPCASWKWLGSEVINSTSVLKDPERFARDCSDDYHVTKMLHDVISQADIVIGHNVDSFDLKQIRKRCIFHGLAPLKHVQTVDTLKVARRVAAFESNQLRYLAKFFKVGEKAESPNWDLIAIGDPDEIRNCERYNRQDVRVLEAVYLKLRAWDMSHPNLNVHKMGVHHPECTKCGCSAIQARGYRYTKAGKYQAYQCTECGSWSQGKKNLKTVEIR